MCLIEFLSSRFADSINNGHTFSMKKERNNSLQGEHLLVEVFKEPPSKNYPLAVYSGGGRPKFFVEVLFLGVSLRTISIGVHLNILR